MTSNDETATVKLHYPLSHVCPSHLCPYFILILSLSTGHKRSDDPVTFRQQLDWMVIWDRDYHWLEVMQIFGHQLPELRG